MSFSYGDGPLALDDVSFSLPAGRVLGVVGRTGSGKSTLARLVLRLYDATGGSVRLDGIDVRDLTLQSLRDAVGIVTQDVQLFEATLRDNLTLFAADADDARLVTVLEDLELGSWFARLPSGLDTVIGGQGVGLSAGEAQLLAFGRVFLRDPGLVILDEASSRLDPATEQRIERAVDRLLEGRTAILIAHRLATLERADEVLVLEQADRVVRRLSDVVARRARRARSAMKLSRLGWRLWKIRPGLATAGTLAWVAFHVMPFFVGTRAPRDLRRDLRLRARRAQCLQPHRDPRGRRSGAVVDLLRRMGVVAPHVGVDERAVASEHARGRAVRPRSRVGTVAAFGR